MVSQKKQVTKIVCVLYTYIFKAIDRVCFVVLSSDGETQYNTCFDHGRATCSCPSHTECYHIRDLRPRYEAIRAARAESQAEVRLATFKAGMDAQYSAAPSKNEKRPPVFASATLEPMPDEDVAAYKARCEAAYQQERRQAAPLNGNRGFSLLR